MVNIAVIGCGYWGKNLVRNFFELGSLTHVSDLDPVRLNEMISQYPGVIARIDYHEILEDPSVDAVVIATNAEEHAVMSKEALLAGKDVFVEKPLALDYRDGQHLVQLASEQKRVLMVGHLLEYHPAVLEILKIVKSGEIGDLQYIYSNRLNLGKVRRHENILWSFAPHDIAVILRLVGEQPTQVSAMGGTYLQPNIADVTITNLTFRSGVSSHIFVSWLHPYKEQRLVIIGSKKMISFNDLTEEKLLLYDQGIDWINGEPIPRKGTGTAIEVESKEPLKHECEHFLECVNSRNPPRTDGASALRVLEVLQACQRSLQNQGHPVQLLMPDLELVTI
jgi:UDP-2-acetamido-3-amino-2,3-dideoxy-glucuronate N-acetyltransferase